MSKPVLASVEGDVRGIPYLIFIVNSINQINREVVDSYLGLYGPCISKVLPKKLELDIEEVIKRSESTTTLHGGSLKEEIMYKEALSNFYKSPDKPSLLYNSLRVNLATGSTAQINELISILPKANRKQAWSLRDLWELSKERPEYEGKCVAQVLRRQILGVGEAHEAKKLRAEIEERYPGLEFVIHSFY